MWAVLAVVDMMWPRSGAQDKWSHVPHVQPPRAFVLMTKRRNEEALRAFPGVGAVCGWVQPGQTCSGGAKGPLSLQAGAVQQKEGTGCSTGQDSLRLLIPDVLMGPHEAGVSFTWDSCA